MPPYLGNGPDPKHKNHNRLMGVKSNTTLGGEGFNEWRFDDTKGKEQIFVHAARNMDVRVKSDSMESVGGSKHVTVGGEKEDGSTYGDYNEWVFHDANQTVLGDLNQDVGGDLKLEIGSRKTGGGGLDLYVHALRRTQIEGSDLVHVKTNRREQVDGNQELIVGGQRLEKVGELHALDAGQEIHLKAGVKVVIEADAQLSLKVGGNFIDISPAGVAIQGTMVLINSGGAPGSGSGASPHRFTLPPPEPVDPPTRADDAKSGFKSCS
jgi:type VI secretion system secreted protein VgrG